MREAQQQRLARPGQQLQAPPPSQMNDENYLISPLVSPHSQNFNAGCIEFNGGQSQSLPSYSPYSTHFDTVEKVESDDCSGNTHFTNNDSILFDDLPSPFMDFSTGLSDVSVQQDWGTIRASTRPSSNRRVSGGIADRVAMFEGICGQSPSPRPITPPNQNSSSKLGYLYHLANMQHC